jgi:hypothetical protein
MELGLRTSEAAALGLTERDWAFALWVVPRRKRATAHAMVTCISVLLRLKMRQVSTMSGRTYPHLNTRGLSSDAPY